MPVKYVVTPRIIKGGSFGGANVTSEYTEFTWYNEVTSYKVDNVSLKMYPKATVVDEDDNTVTLLIEGISRIIYERHKTGVSVYGDLPAHVVLRDSQGNTIIDDSYQMGRSDKREDRNIQSHTSQRVVINKSNNRTPVNIKLVSLEDRGVYESGDNFVDLYVTEIVYEAPPKKTVTYLFQDIDTSTNVADPIIEQQSNVMPNKYRNKSIPNYNFVELQNLGTTIIQKYRKAQELYLPWAIRKSGAFKTLDRPTGYFKIRKATIWLPTEKVDRLRTRPGTSYSQHRIRKEYRGSSYWKDQDKIGGN